jgi:type 1 fimbria pilin
MNRSKRSGATKFLRCCVPVLALLAGAQGAWAACVRYPTWEERFVNMDMGRVVIPNDLPVNGVIASKTFPILYKGPTDWMFDCTSGGGVVSGVMLQGEPVPGYNHIYTTKVAGVGIRLSRTIELDAPPTYYPHDIYPGSARSRMSPTSKFQVELIKIAAVTGNGPLAAGTYTRYFGNGAPGLSAITTTLSGNGITIITPSCSVDLGSRNISVQFGRVPQSNFKGRGTTTGDRSFSIKLNCKAGRNAQNTVYLRMDATPDPSNEQGVLKITQGGVSTATGVGIQMVDNQSVPVKFGENALVGPSKDGDYVLPYTARYFQTGASVTPGRADGTATFTLDYK